MWRRSTQSYTTRAHVQLTRASASGVVIYQAAAGDHKASLDLEFLTITSTNSPPDTNEIEAKTHK